MTKKPNTVSGQRVLQLREKLFGICNNIWFFPAVLLLIVLGLSFSQISGSSIGIYHELLYGDSTKDENLLFNEPRAVRSDEWLVTTQLSLAQVEANFTPINTNIGEGIDVSLLVDAPTATFAQAFKPHNLGFFVLPIGVAFALKWWLMAYLLVMAVYFFVLTLMPKRKVLAVVLSLGFLASPFIAWWYQYITLAPIYYTLFGCIVAIKLMHASTKRVALLWGLLLAYIATSFALVLYPPFQVPCVLVALAFLIGYVLDNRRVLHGTLKPALVGGAMAIVMTVVLIAICLVPKLPVIETITGTAYPGNRLTESGGFNPMLFFASNTSLLEQDNPRAAEFKWSPNQSEGSNFMLVFILLTPILIFILVKYRKRVPNFWTATGVLLVTAVFMVWLFVPDVDILGKATLLDRVLHARLLIGFGLINLLVVIIFIQMFEKKQFKLPRFMPEAYALVALVIYVVLNLYIAKLFPGFMGYRWALLLALPYPLILYMLLKRWFNLAAVAFLLISVVSVMSIHPLYRGVDILSNTEPSKTIKDIDTANSKRWVTDSLQLENYALLNGKQSLSGVYVYPDKGLWEQDFPASDNSKYNRYSHVYFQFDRNEHEVIERKLDQPSPDQLIPSLEPCDKFLQKNNVGYILTTQSFSAAQAPCAELIRLVSVPKANIYIYKLNF